MQHRLSKTAETELATIFRQGRELFGRAPVTRYAETLFEALFRLEDHPYMGMVWEEADALTIRRIFVGTHYFYYRVFETEIVVGRILHACMDVPKQFDEIDFL